jgi:hypothetical protein
MARLPAKLCLHEPPEYSILWQLSGLPDRQQIFWYRLVEDWGFSFAPLFLLYMGAMTVADGPAVSGQC